MDRDGGEREGERVLEEECVKSKGRNDREAVGKRYETKEKRERVDASTASNTRESE